jgi:hypothetical protein
LGGKIKRGREKGEKKNEERGKKMRQGEVKR